MSQETVNNCLKKPTNAYKNRRALVSDDFSLKDVKKQCRKYKCTLNDAFLAFIGQTINEYARRRGEDITDIGFSSTYSMRQMARSLKDVHPENDWVPQIYRISTQSSFEKNLAQVKTLQKSLVSSRLMIGNRYFIYLANSMLYCFA